MAGMPPATAAPNSRRWPDSRARSRSSGPLSAIKSLFAVTTDLPELSARRIQSPAGSMPPTSSTMTSASEESSSSTLSVQGTLAGTQSTFFFSTLRLQIWVNSRGPPASWQRSLTTERPTVPKPIKATFSFLGGVAAAPEAEFSAAADLGGTAARPDLRAGVDAGAGAGDFAVATGAWPLAEALFFSAALVRLREPDDG